MKRTPLDRPHVWVSPLVYLQAAALCLLLPLQWALALAVSVAVHEASHILMFRLLKLPINEIRVYPMGVRILSPALTPREELLCAAAGPLGGAGLILLAGVFPAVALCGAFHSLYNLLPFRSSDGGRILRSLCVGKLHGKLAVALPGAVEWVVGAGIVLVGLYGSLRLRLGLLPVLLGCCALWNPRRCK